MSVVYVAMKVRVINCWNGSSRGIICFYKVKNKKMLVPWQLFAYFHSLFYVFSVVLLHTQTRTHKFASKTLLHSQDVACVETVIFHSKRMQISCTCTLSWSVISRGWGLKEPSLTHSEARFNTWLLSPLSTAMLVDANTHLHTKTERIKGHLSAGLQVKLQVEFQRGDDQGRTVTGRSSG